MSTKTICFRVDESQKTRIEAAARTLGKSTTTFIVEVLMSQVEKVEARPQRQQNSKAHTGVPTYFRALCREAGQGGSFGFRMVGHQFARHIANERPYSLDDDEWTKDLQALRSILEPFSLQKKGVVAYLAHAGEEFQAKLWGWFEEHYPKMMELVPARRRTQFLIGILDALEDETIGLEE